MNKKMRKSGYWPPFKIINQEPLNMLTWGDREKFNHLPSKTFIIPAEGDVVKK